APAARLSNDSAKRHRCLQLPNPVGAEVAGHPWRTLRCRPDPALAFAPVGADRRNMVPARARILRRRAWLGNPYQGRGYGDDLRCDLDGGTEARAEAFRHVRAGFAAAGKRLSRLEAGSVDRL